MNHDPQPATHNPIDVVTPIARGCRSEAGERPAREHIALSCRVISKPILGLHDGAKDVTSIRLHGIKACVFDAYGTLFDVNSASRAAQDALGAQWQPLADLWRTKQLQYTWLRGLGGTTRTSGR